jgi:2-oxoglutarate decarboxylase
VPESVPVTLPAMGESVSEGTVARWVKQVGELVTEGEPVVEVTTDKVDVEVPAPASGTLTEISAGEGDTVPVGGTLGRIVEGSPPAGNGHKRTAAPVVSPPAPADEGSADVVATAEASPAPAVPSPAPSPAPPRPHVAATPLARRAAAIAGVDLATLDGGGPGGLVRRADVTAPQRPADGRAQAPAVADGESATALRGPQAALVDYMEQSRSIPTATSFRTFSVARLDARRRELNSALAGRGQKVSFTHLIAHAVARAAGEMPQMAAHFARDSGGKPVRVDSGIHLGLAVDSRRKDGTRFLVVPVVRDADRLDFAAFHAEYERLIERARTNTMSADELRGATLSLTNPGGIGTVASVPRLMPGQGTIIATGAIGYPPEWRHLSEARIRELGAGKVMTMTSTYDHRIIQGAESGEFLARVEALLAGADGFYEAIFTSLALPAPVEAAELPVPRPAPAAASGGASPGATVGRELLAAMQAATSLVKAHRTHGHLGAHLDPLGSQPIGDPAMEPDQYHLTPELMEQIPADLLRVYVPGRTLAEVLPNLRSTYCGTIAYEIEHISSHEQRVWLREHIESGAYRLPLSTKEKLRLLHRLTKVDAMERYLRRTFLGQKTFSGEGVDMLVPMLEKLLGMAADDGIGEVVAGMSHRGRLATIAHVVNRPYESVLVAFERGEMRRAVGVGSGDPTGDVKYHLGATGTYVTENEKPITVRLLPNPSHLEAIDGVVEGWTRAEQTRRDHSTLHHDPTAAMPLLIHGDAAFPAQGVVAEVLNLQSLQGYSTGGTVHIIANNQIGFTTDPSDARSTRYASDLAKGFDIPIVHVNADDVEACITAVRLAYDYRRTYHQDVVIDLIGYRRFGHNETDEPAYTQPVLYQRIKQHKTVRELFVEQLVAEGLVTAEEAEQQSQAVFDRLAEAHKRVKSSLASPGDETVSPQPLPPSADDTGIVTAVASDVLAGISEQLLLVPDGFVMNRKLAKQLEKRRESLAEGGVDWGTAEALAFGSLLLQGKPVRLTGQDSERGTFSHRHLVLHDERTGAEHVPIQHLVGSSATFEIHNSPLSEVATLSFEYGYSAADADTLVLWEAQFGDFANNAQMVIDQFIVSSQAKWGQRSRLTLLLPHGYEGMGPEHSSARLERFLQLSASGNIRVASASTTAQYFHLVRNQGLATVARPLVVMTPKSLLRLKEAQSPLSEFVTGGFQSVLDDPDASQRPDDVRSLVLCTGKLYWELQLHADRAAAHDLAIARVELLDPLPLERMLAVIEGYPNLEHVYWAQEEPRNMGAWHHLARPIGKRISERFGWDYIGRPRRASPSEGFAGSHHLEQERIVLDVLRTAPSMRDLLAAPGDETA